MPSWNIHTAHVERLLREHEAAELGIRDVNCFLVGNFVPDIYVGYMVPHTTRTIDYRTTHLADGAHIPVPRADEFWDRYVEGQGRVTDVVLGAWTHLVADHVYNAHTRAFLAAHGIEPGERARVGKQSDFATFGRTLDISLLAEVTPELVAQCAAFPQYAVAEPDVRGAIEVANRIVATNAAEHVVGEPAYIMLDAAFFAAAREEANDWMVRGLLAYAATL